MLLLVGRLWGRIRRGGRASGGVCRGLVCQLAML